MKISRMNSRGLRQSRHAPTKTAIGSIAVAASALLILAGCSTAGAGSPASQPTQATQDLEQSAKEEGQVVVYTNGSEDSLKPYVDAFAKKYGITVKILEDSGGPLWQRFSQEAASGRLQNDILILSDHAPMEDAIKNKWLAEYTPAGGELFPAEFSHAGYYYPVTNGFEQTVTYNVNKVSAEELSMLRNDPMAALEDPRFKGRIGVNPPSTSQQVAALWYLLAEGPGAQKYGWDALQKVADNKPGFFSTGPLGTKVIAGEYAVGFGIASSFVSRHAMSGAPVEFSYLTPTTGATFETGVVANSPHPNAARLFMEWATTPEANELYAAGTETRPLNSKAKDTRKILDFDWYHDPTDVWSEWPLDEKFLSDTGRDGDFLAKWSDMFGYSAN